MDAIEQERLLIDLGPVALQIVQHLRKVDVDAGTSIGDAAMDSQMLGAGQAALELLGKAIAHSGAPLVSSAATLLNGAAAAAAVVALEQGLPPDDAKAAALAAFDNAFEVVFYPAFAKTAAEVKGGAA